MCSRDKGFIVDHATVASKHWNNDVIITQCAGGHIQPSRLGGDKTSHYWIDLHVLKRNSKLIDYQAQPQPWILINSWMQQSKLSKYACVFELLLPRYPICIIMSCPIMSYIFLSGFGRLSIKLTSYTTGIRRSSHTKTTSTISILASDKKLSKWHFRFSDGTD